MSHSRLLYVDCLKGFLNILIHFLILQIVFTWPSFEDAVVVGICIYTVIVSIISYALSKACLRYRIPALLVMGKWPHRADSAIMAR